MTITPEFIICICTYRRPRLLARLLEDLSQQSVLPGMVIIVDGDPATGEVRDYLSPSQFPFAVTYIPSNHANLAYQRYLCWRAACTLGCSVLLYLDDDLHIEQRDAVEKVIQPLREDPEVVGVTAHIRSGDPREKFREVPVLQERAGRKGPLLSWLVRYFGSRTPPGGLTPSGHRRTPQPGRDYASVEWLYGRVMAYRMAALTQECFSVDLFAMYESNLGKAEDTYLSCRVHRKAKMLLAFNATFLHPDDALPVAYPIQARRLAYAIAYSRRFLNDHYRDPLPPTLADRLALVRSYLGNIALSWGSALRRPARHRFAYAWGYTAGALRGLVDPPSARRLTPHIDWWKDAEEALRNTVEIVKGS